MFFQIMFKCINKTVSTLKCVKKTQQIDLYKQIDRCKSYKNDFLIFKKTTS